ncbi:MAG: hypothetical protein R3F58_09390 [Steroidobacteraceae bacterium]
MTEKSKDESWRTALQAEMFAAYAKALRALGETTTRSHVAAVGYHAVAVAAHCYFDGLDLTNRRGEVNEYELAALFEVTAVVARTAEHYRSFKVTGDAQAYLAALQFVPGAPAPVIPAEIREVIARDDRGIPTAVEVYRVGNPVEHRAVLKRLRLAGDE